MHGTLEQLRDANPGKWLLIRLDDPEAETGTVLTAAEDPEVLDSDMVKHFQPEDSLKRPLYLTYSILEGEQLPSYAL